MITFARYLIMLMILSTGVSFSSSLQAKDVIHLKNGRQLAGEVQRLQGTSLKFSLQTEAGSANSSIPIDQVDTIEFGHRAAIREMMNDLSSQNIDSLREQWNTQQHLVTLPKSEVGEIAIALARLLVAQNAEASHREALALVQQIVASDWNQERRERAGELIIEIEITLGDSAEIEAKTAEWLQSGEPLKRITASYMRALVMIEDYKAFLAENPRWQQDPVAAQEHQRLYHGIFDLLLIPSQEYRLRGERTARSVWEMARFYEYLGQRKLAVSVARDIIEIYPDTSFRGLAEKFIQENPTDS